MKEYYIGLQKDIQLIIDENSFEYQTISENHSRVKIHGYIDEKQIDIFEEYINDEIHNRLYAVVKLEEKVMSEEGDRWEGDWYDGKPFGFGSFFDEEGNRIYSGFAFEGKKIGFGTEFFSDTHTVDYCGNYVNDRRHGWGTSYDRNGQKLFEGDWRCGKNGFDDERIVIEDNCEEDDLRVYDLIKELEIGVNCLNKWEGDLIIQNYPNLQSIIVKNNSLKYLNSMKICNCEKLKIIEMKDGVFCNVKNVIIESI